MNVDWTLPVHAENVSRELRAPKSTHFELLDGHRSRNYRCGPRKV